MDALGQIIHNILHENIPIPEENKRKVLRHKDALVSLGELDVLAQEGGGFIQDLLTPVISSLGFLMLLKQGLILKVDHLHLTVNER